MYLLTLHFIANDVNKYPKIQTYMITTRSNKPPPHSASLGSRASPVVARSFLMSRICNKTVLHCNARGREGKEIAYPRCIVRHCYWPPSGTCPGFVFEVVCVWSTYVRTCTYRHTGLVARLVCKAENHGLPASADMHACRSVRLYVCQCASALHQ